MPVLDATFEPATVSYLPRGFIHPAQALAGTSLHLTFGVHSAIERDIVKAVMETSRVIRWRLPLPRWNRSSPEGHAQIQQVVDELREIF